KELSGFDPGRGTNLIFPWMFVLLPPAVATCVDDDESENEEAHDQQQYYAGLVFPDLLKAIRKLGPIHAIVKYTFCPKNKLPAAPPKRHYPGIPTKFDRSFRDYGSRIGFIAGRMPAGYEEIKKRLHSEPQ